MYSIDLFNLVYNQITNNKKQVASVILLQLMQFSYSMQYLLSYGPTQVKCRLLISGIFDTINFQHFLEMLEIMLHNF